MQLPIYQVDAFAERLFAGNPAAVCPLDAWLDEGRMQSIAFENNLSETAFLVPSGDGETWDLRWFTPKAEVDLCGHATLAAAFVVLTKLRPGRDVVRFRSRGGPLVVRRLPGGGGLLELDFPADPPEPWDAPDALTEALGRTPRQTLRGSLDYALAVLEDERSVRDLRPVWSAFESIEPHGVIVTAPGRDVDFVSRFFAPRLGVPEDPVTGSAHCVLTPYWARVLRKPRLSARQLSERGGELTCELRGERVGIAGRVVAYLEGRITV